MLPVPAPRPPRGAHRRTSSTDPHGKRNQLDVYRPRDVTGHRAPAPVLLPDPRRRLGHRRQEPAGPPADAAPRVRGLGVRCDQLPAQPQGDLSRPSHRLQARAGLGARAHRRVRRRSRPHLRHRRVGGRAPRRDGRAHRERGAIPAGVRGRRHVGRRVHPLLRGLRLRLDVRRRSGEGPRGTTSGPVGHESDPGRGPRRVRRRVSRAPRPRRCAAVLRHPRHQ